MRPKIVITGGAGFIGSHLTDALLERGYQVVAYDNLSMGTMDNLTQHLGNPAFEFVLGDVCEYDALLEACQDAQTIVHLAAFKIPRYGKTVDTLRINNLGVHNVLDAARACGSKVVLASTSDVYGKSAALPFREDGDSVIGPSTIARWSYAVSKLFDEHMCFAYAEAYGVPSVILRFFGAYGPRQHRTWWGGPQAVFIDAILSDRELEIHGDGQQTRTFTYITDLVAGIVGAVERDAAVGQIINLGHTREISILGLALLIKQLSGTPGTLKYRMVPYSTFGNYEDVRRRVPDISKARQLLDFEPQVSLEEGLRRTIEWQRDLMAIPVPIVMSEQESVRA
jgi:UDP-glucose 4-epimerase